LRADIVKRGIHAGKVTVIPNAVDINAFQLAGKPSPELQEKYGLAGKTVIGFIGSYYAYEGLDLLLDALPGILKVRADIQVLLVGGGPQESNLKKQAEALGISANVSFVGRVPHSEVNRYYDLIDILAYPRHPMRLTELVTPLKPLEAMAQGQIFVASDVGGHKELIRHQETGILFKAGDSAALAAAILDLLEKNETWQSMRDAGRRYVESERNWKNSVANYISPYKKLLEK
jgi:PEP-CTERM/exosortase A-associated glycosyltransferase